MKIYNITIFLLLIHTISLQSAQSSFKSNNNQLLNAIELCNLNQVKTILATNPPSEYS